MATKYGGGRPSGTKGHRLNVVWSGSMIPAERSSTGTCTCGWEAKASLRAEVFAAYHSHLEKVRVAQEKKDHKMLASPKPKKEVIGEPTKKQAVKKQATRTQSVQL